MEIIMKVTVPDSYVTEATENSCGEEGDMPEWLADFFEGNDVDYLRDLGFHEMTVEVIDIN